MSAMSEPPRELAALSVEELRAALGRQRAVNTELRGVIATQAELHQAELAARDALIAGLRSQVAVTDVQIVELRSQVAVLGERVAQLERQAGRDSSNSSKPPSSDSPYTKTPRKPKGRSLRGRSGRKPGKQPGDPGTTLAQVPDPDHIVVCAPDRCAGCGHDLADAPAAAEHKRQVLEAPPPPPRPVVTEYRVQARVCGVCGVTSVGQAPGFASGRAQYGPGVCAHAANLTVANHVPVGRAAGLLGDLLGVGCSVGFVAGVRGRAAGLLEPFMARVRELLGQAGVLYVDETPGRAGGGLVYVHVAMADLLVHANKAAGAARAVGAAALEQATLAEIVAWYRGAVTTGIVANQGKRTRTATDGLRLARRFQQHEAMILRFATDLSVGFTNNQAERDVRPVKVQQRSSGGCWRTLQGLADFAVVQSYLATAAKWGVDKLEALRQLFATGPWLPPAIPWRGLTGYLTDGTPSPSPWHVRPCWHALRPGASRAQAPPLTLNSYAPATTTGTVSP